MTFHNPPVTLHTWKLPHNHVLELTPGSILANFEAFLAVAIQHKRNVSHKSKRRLPKHFDVIFVTVSVCG